MTEHSSVVEMLDHVRAMKAEGLETVTISAPPYLLAHLGLPMAGCKLSIMAGEMICISRIDPLLAMLERRLARLEN